MPSELAKRLAQALPEASFIGGTALRDYVPRQRVIDVELAEVREVLSALQQPPAVSERCETQNHVFTCVRCSRQWDVVSSDELECFFSGLCYWCLRETGISQEGVKTALTTGTGEQRCTWAIADGWITTSCGENFVVHDDFDEGDHGMKFCSFCGKSLSGPGSTPAHSERCIKCGHSDGVDNGGLCCFMGEGDPVRAQAIGQASTPWPCGCKCVFPATGATIADRENQLRFMEHFWMKVEPHYVRKHGHPPPEQSALWELLQFVINTLEALATTGAGEDEQQ